MKVLALLNDPHIHWLFKELEGTDARIKRLNEEIDGSVGDAENINRRRHRAGALEDRLLLNAAVGQRVLQHLWPERVQEVINYAGTPALPTVEGEDMFLLHLQGVRAIEAKRNQLHEECSGWSPFKQAAQQALDEALTDSKVEAFDALRYDIDALYPPKEGT